MIEIDLYYCQFIEAGIKNLLKSEEYLLIPIFCLATSLAWLFPTLILTEESGYCPGDGIFVCVTDDNEYSLGWEAKFWFLFGCRLAVFSDGETIWL